MPEIQVGCNKLNKVVLTSPLLLTDTIFCPDVLIDRAPEPCFPERNVFLKINEICYKI